jgi:hypothetical protein
VVRRENLAGWFLALGFAAAPALGTEKQDAVVEVGPAIFQLRAAPRAVPGRADLVLAAPRLPEDARHALGELTAAERTELQAPDRRGGARLKRPAMKVGISRDLPLPIGFDGLPDTLASGGSRSVSGGLLERSDDGSLSWTASFSSAGAGALRLYIQRAHLPAGSRVYVYGEAGEIQGPYAFPSGTRPEGFWTNTIFSDRLFLEARLPATATPAEIGKAVLLVGAVVHLEHPDFAPSAAEKAGVRQKSQTCFIDRSCVTASDFPNVDQATRAIGQLNFVDGGTAYACSGGLLNTTAGSSVPYLLTANHCFSTQASATSLEAFWQYRTATCNGPYPDESLFPHTLGSTLLATGAVPTSDFTFVQLSQDPPGDSVLLGWTTADVSHADGLALYRLSYANGNPMIYTREQVNGNGKPPTCVDEHGNKLAQGTFLFEKDVAGGTGEGSSGSPLYLEDLRVVGQEYGVCGTNTADDCDNLNNSTPDGAFRVTYPSVQQWLSPGSPASCVAGPTTLCLNGGRFRVTAFYATAAGASGPGMRVALTGDSGYFWFFDPANIELVVKVLDACTFSPPNFWVFAGGLTNVGVTLIVEDTQTGASRTYNNPIGTPFAPLQDTQAFSCP